MTVEVDGDNRVVGFVRVKEWGDDFPPMSYVRERLVNELRPGDYDALPYERRERLDIRISDETDALIAKYMDSPNADFSDIISDATAAMREAIERHKGVYLDELTAASDGDQQASDASSDMYTDSAVETVRAILGKTPRGHGRD